MEKENTDGGTPAQRTLYVQCADSAHLDDVVRGVQGVFSQSGIPFDYDPKRNLLPSVNTLIVPYEGPVQEELEEELRALPGVQEISVASEAKIPEKPHST